MFILILFLLVSLPTPVAGRLAEEVERRSGQRRGTSRAASSLGERGSGEEFLFFSFKQKYLMAG